jgi:hypothetical protein
MKGLSGKLIAGLAIGGGMMYLFDPQSGIRRRTILRDRSVRLSRKTGRAIGEARRQIETGYQRVSEGTQVAVGTLKRLAARGETLDDAALEDRMRACIARHSSHPEAIVVSVRGGRATLGGPVLAREVREVLQCASAINGVTAVDNRLEVHAEAGSVPGLQGEPHSRGLMRRFWEASPGLRMAASATAASLLAVAAGRRLMG